MSNLRSNINSCILTYNNYYTTHTHLHSEVDGWSGCWVQPKHLGEREVVMELELNLESRDVFPHVTPSFKIHEAPNISPQQVSKRPTSNKNNMMTMRVWISVIFAYDRIHDSLSISLCV